MAKQRIDLDAEVGKTYGKLTILGIPEDQRTKLVHAKALVQCECGNKGLVELHALRRGKTKTCGCSKTEKYRDPRDLVGTSSGKLQVIGIKSIERPMRNSKLVVQCGCGKVKEVLARHWLSKHPTSCGCERGERFIVALQGAAIGPYRVLEILGRGTAGRNLKVRVVCTRCNTEREGYSAVFKQYAKAHTKCPNCQEAK